MSYILDALKKSDQERKRGDVPGLQTVHIPMASEQSAPWALYAFVAFLLLVLAFVIGMMVSGRDNNIVQEQGLELGQEPSPSADPVEIMPLKASTTNLQVKDELAQKVVNRAVQVENKQTMRGLETDNQTLWTQNSSKIQEASISGAVNANPSVSVQDLSEVPYLHELANYQQQSIPEMSFAGHVYSSTASNRSIIINNRAMSEGDEVTQGLSVELITSNGVVFRFEDILFKMDILQDWSFE